MVIWGVTSFIPLLPLPPQSVSDLFSSINGGNQLVSQNWDLCAEFQAGDQSLFCVNDL